MIFSRWRSAAAARVLRCVQSASCLRVAVALHRALDLPPTAPVREASIVTELSSSVLCLVLSPALVVSSPRSFAPSAPSSARPPSPPPASCDVEGLRVESDDR